MSKFLDKIKAYLRRPQDIKILVLEESNEILVLKNIGEFGRVEEWN